jgi:hypothetical protein
LTSALILAQWGELRQFAAFRKNQGTVRIWQLADLAGGFFGVSDGVHALNYTLVISFVKENQIIFLRLTPPRFQGCRALVRVKFNVRMIYCSYNNG